MSHANKQLGFSLIESMMAVLIFSLSGLAFSSFVTISANTQSKNKTKMSVAQSKGQVLAMIANRATWFRNLKDAGIMTYEDAANIPKDMRKGPPHILNPELACIRDGTLCTESKNGYPLTLTDQNGKLVVDAIDTGKGFTREGAVCSGFDDTKTNEACPWRMSLTWNPICPTAAPCKHPQVNINVTILASQTFLESSNLTTTQVSVLIEQPKIQPAFARKALFLTNSVHYGYPSDLIIDPSPYVVSDSPGKLTFSLPKTVTVRGGKVTQSGQNFIYQPTYDASVVPVPAEKIYGTDWFTYKIKDSYTGIETIATAYIQVMTPYTWTGLAGGGDLSLKNQKNFCGKVVNNACDGKTFPSSFLNANVDANLIFNENCTNCDASIKAKAVVTSLETSPYYAGTITQNADVIAGGYTATGSTWKKSSAFRFTSGIWDGKAGTLSVTNRGELYNCWLCQVPLNTYFRLEGGTFKAPPLVEVAGSLYMPSPTAFQHNNGTFRWMGMVQYGSPNCAGDCYIGSDEVAFFNLIVGAPKANVTDTTTQLGGFNYVLGWGNRTFIQNGFKVMNNLTIANVAGEAELATYQPSATIKLYGDLILSDKNAGGAWSYGLTSTIVMSGTRDQKIVGQPLTEAERRDYNRHNCAPGITVDKEAGKLTMMDMVCFSGDLLLKNAGSFDMQKVNLTNRGFLWYQPVALDLHGQEIDGLYYLSNLRLAPKTDFVVNKMLYFDTQGTIGAIINFDSNMRTIHVRGDAAFGPNADFSGDQCAKASTFLFDGTGDQSVDGSMDMNRGIGNHFNIKKPSGKITFNGEIGVMQDFLIQGGQVAFGPTFGIHNVMTGADFIRTRILLNDPVNQTFSKIVSNRTIEALSPIYVKDLTLNSVGSWIGPHYSNLFGGASYPLYVSGDLSFGNVNVSSTGYNVSTNQVLMAARSGTQQVILNGVGAQKITIIGADLTGAGPTLDLQIQKSTSTPTDRVTIFGNGQIRNMTVASGATVDLDTNATLSLTGVVRGTLNKNGNSPTGTLTASGGGVINN